MNPYSYITELPEITSLVVGIDTETTGLDPHTDEFIVLQVAVPGQTYLIRPEHANILTPLLVDESIIKVMQNAAFDMKFFRKHLGVWALNIWDTMQIEKVLTSGTKLKVGLGHIALRRFNMDIDKGVRQSFIGHIGSDLTDEQQEYAALDAEVLLYIYRQQLEEVEDTGVQAPADLANRVVCPIANMELAGLGFDLDLWFEYLEELWHSPEGLIATRSQVIKLLKPARWRIDIFGNMVGPNLNSPPQRKLAIERLLKKRVGTRTEVLKVVAEEMSAHVTNAVRSIAQVPIEAGELPETMTIITPKKSLPTILPDTKRPTIKRFRAIYMDDKVVVEALDAYLRYTTLATMVGWGYEEYVHPRTKRIHTSYIQNGAKTSRLSSRKPNLQNISNPVDGLPNLRNLFYSLGGELVTADYSQQEPRILAQLSQDPALIQVCAEGDFHLNVTRIIYEDNTIEKSDPRRKIGKRAGLGMAYGMGPATFSETAEIPYEEAERIIAVMKAQFPTAEAWAQTQLDKAVRLGYVTTLLGRRIHFPGDVGFEKNKYAPSARNWPVQGSAAETLKEVMARLWWDYLFNKETQETVHGTMAMTVHDEITIDTDPGLVDRPSPAFLVDEIMLQVFAEVGVDMVPDVPIIAESSIGVRWSK